MINFPITAEAAYSVLGLAFVVAVLVQLVKLFVTEPRILNLVAIGAGLLLALCAMLVLTNFRPSPGDLMTTFLIALFAVAIATLGYEAVTNLAGLVGYGPKSTQSQMAKARVLLHLEE